MAVHLSVAGDVFDSVLFCAVLIPRDVFGEIWTELSQLIRIFQPFLSKGCSVESKSVDGTVYNANQKYKICFRTGPNLQQRSIICY